VYICKEDLVCQEHVSPDEPVHLASFEREFLELAA
jgi:hypothetical protein